MVTYQMVSGSDLQSPMYVWSVFTSIVENCGWKTMFLDNTWFQRLPRAWFNKDTSAASYGTILLNFVLAMIYGYIATCLWSVIRQFFIYWGSIINVFIIYTDVTLSITYQDMCGHWCRNRGQVLPYPSHISLAASTLLPPPPPTSGAVPTPVCTWSLCRT